MNVVAGRIGGRIRMMDFRRHSIGIQVLSLSVVLLACFPADCSAAESAKHSSSIKEQARYRGPVDLAIAEDETWAVTVNELSSSLTLVDLTKGQVIDEVPCGLRPVSIARLSDRDLLVSCRDAGVVQKFRVADHQLDRLASIPVGFHPSGLAIDRTRQRAFVGLMASGEVAELDLRSDRLIRRLAAGRWPRYLALAPDGKRLAIGLSGDSCVAVMDAVSGEILYEEPISGGINMGHMRASASGEYVYFPWMIYRTNPIDVGNIRRGWVLASRVARVRLDGPAYREAISLDVPRLAVADPHGLVITPNEHRMAVTSSGTHELLVYRLGDLPFIGTGGPGDLIDNRLLRDKDLFYRIELGGRPMGVEPSRDNRTVFVANHLTDAIQIVDLEGRQVVGTISLGATATDPQAVLVHRGMEIFHDARRSLDQWYSCHSCHLDAGSNAKAMDTWNDGSALTTKTVLPLAGVTSTGPWTWHGWQKDLDDSIQNSFVSTMQGKRGTQEDVNAVRAYLASLKPVPSPFRDADGGISEAAMRGKKQFESSEVGCADCHSGPLFTDGQVHDVGLGSESDKYSGYNTPSLIGVYQKVRLLHDGRAKSLEKVLDRWHRPQDIGGGAELTPRQRSDLIEYLKSL